VTREHVGWDGLTDRERGQPEPPRRRDRPAPVRADLAPVQQPTPPPHTETGEQRAAKQRRPLPTRIMQALSLPKSPDNGIFVSYRRTQSAWAAGRLSDRLVDRFGKRRVFTDVDSIEPGLDFTLKIRNAVATCAVLLVVIGPQWLDALDEAGRRRLEDPEDWVRVEVEEGLRGHARVIPVLVEGALMPRRNQLPDAIKELADRQSVPLRHESFKSDVDELLRTIAKAVTRYGRLR
jgi:hypothetical protein